MTEIKLFTPAECAKILRVTRRSVYGYIKSGRLKSAKMGREWRVTEEHLREFANTGTKNNYLPGE